MLSVDITNSAQLARKRALEPDFVVSHANMESGGALENTATLETSVALENKTVPCLTLKNNAASENSVALENSVTLQNKAVPCLALENIATLENSVALENKTVPCLTLKNTAASDTSVALESKTVHHLALKNTADLEKSVAWENSVTLQNQTVPRLTLENTVTLKNSMTLESKTVPRLTLKNIAALENSMALENKAVPPVASKNTAALENSVAWENSVTSQNKAVPRLALENTATLEDNRVTHVTLNNMVPRVVSEDNVALKKNVALKDNIVSKKNVALKTIFSFVTSKKKLVPHLSLEFITPLMNNVSLKDNVVLESNAALKNSVTLENNTLENYVTLNNNVDPTSDPSSPPPTSSLLPSSHSPSPLIGLPVADVPTPPPLDTEQHPPYPQKTSSPKNIAIHILSAEMDSDKLLHVYIQGFCKHAFSIEIQKDTHRVEFETLEDHAAVVAALKAKRIQYYTFSLDPSKVSRWTNRRFVIRGVPKHESTQFVVKYLSAAGISAKDVYKMKHPTTKKEMPLIRVSVHVDEEKNLLSLRRIGNHKIHVERHWLDIGPQQCFSCQRFGHSIAFCSMKPRCVRCALSHQTRDCTTKWGDLGLCVNCGGGHYANDPLCAVYVTAARTHWRKYGIKRDVGRPDASKGVQFGRQRFGRGNNKVANRDEEGEPLMVKEPYAWETMAKVTESIIKINKVPAIDFLAHYLYNAIMKNKHSLM